MLDDLREQADNGLFLDDTEDIFGFEDTAPKQTLFLGMTAVQRFVIAVMAMMMVCILSSFCLLLTEKIYLPFL